MASRCPSAIQLGSAYLPNWRLVFRGVADIEFTNNSDDLLPIGVWQLTKECEESLDIYEGFPNLYKKISVNGMMTYTMNQKNLSVPSKAYFNSILEGYEDFNLNTDHLFKSLGRSYHKQPEYNFPKHFRKISPLQKKALNILNDRAIKSSGNNLIGK